MEEYDFPPWLANMFVFFILFNNMVRSVRARTNSNITKFTRKGQLALARTQVPISMYIALDIVNLIHAKMIGKDKLLCDDKALVK